MSIKVLLVDDQAMVRAGIHMILEAENDIHVIGEAEDGAKAVAAARKLKPDVILMDIQMPLLNGLEATRQLTQMPGNIWRILILTTFERDDYVFEALRAGASGFILKKCAPGRFNRSSPRRGRRQCAAGALGHTAHYSRIRTAHAA